MKYILFSIFLSLISFSGKAQYSFEQVDSMLRNIKLDANVQKYYEYINKAELEILNGDWVKSASYFHTAFTYHRSISSFDHMLYLTVALQKSNDSASVVNFLAYCRKPQEPSYPVDSLLLMYSSFSPQITKMPFWKNLHLVLDTVSPLPAASFEKRDKESGSYCKIIQFLDSLEEEDQYNIQMMTEKFKYNGCMNPDNPIAKKRCEYVNHNLDLLMKIWKENDFFSDEGRPLSNVYLIVVHTRSCDPLNLAWLPIIIKKVEKGEMRNKNLYDIIDYYFSNSGSKLLENNDMGYYGKTSGKSLYNQYMSFVMPNKDEMDMRRAKLGLCTLDEQVQLQRWQFKNNLEWLYTGGNCEMEHIKDGEDPNPELLKKQNEIIKRYTDKGFKFILYPR